MNRSPVLAVVVALAWTGLVAPPPATSGAPAGSTITFTSDTTYVVSTKVGGREVTGRGRLPDGFTASSVTARPARNALGSRAVEVLVDHGNPIHDMSARGHAVFTHHRGKLRPVTLKGRALVLATYTEGGDDGGFRCRDGRLVLHWFHHGSGRGEQTTYRLAGARLVQVSRTPLRRPVASKPASCA